MNGKIFLFAAVLLLGITSCHKPEADLAFRFSFSVGDEALRQDSVCYVNAAGNHFSVTEVQFFISKVTLVGTDGTQYALLTDEGIHYVDADIPSTLIWQLSDDHLPAGRYDRIDFVFGLAPEYNITHHFVNPPENSMSWPEALGGGYHHLKLNGFWLGSEQQLKPFNMHLGTGQSYDGEGGITGFIDNAFKVTIPLEDVVLEGNTTTRLKLNMDITQWFENPNLVNLDVIGGSIMQNQAAQEMLVENGKTVFSACLSD
ncbi:MAG: hypothetical protein J5741_07890 [Bacteroidales bacterium]|nr:hypothetical protein [Bacteroidales bacterium]